MLFEYRVKLKSVVGLLALIRPDTTSMVEWPLKVNYQSIYMLAHSSFSIAATSTCVDNLQELIPLHIPSVDENQTKKSS